MPAGTAIGLSPSQVLAIEQVTDNKVKMQGGRSIPNGLPQPIEQFPDPLLHLTAPHEIAVLPLVTE